jgi:hypothetical protein
VLEGCVGRVCWKGVLEGCVGRVLEGCVWWVNVFLPLQTVTVKEKEEEERAEEEDKVVLVDVEMNTETVELLHHPVPSFVISPSQQTGLHTNSL